VLNQEKSQFSDSCFGYEENIEINKAIQSVLKSNYIKTPSYTLNYGNKDDLKKKIQICGTRKLSIIPF
jgi:hypothetical protein